MDMAMQLLSDFQYNKLQAGVAYQPDGKFNLDLQFQGKNPGFFNGKPTHLNVNLEYNLLDLLESLRIADDIITRSEEHTSELQSRPHLVCRLLLEKKKI